MPFICRITMNLKHIACKFYRGPAVVVASCVEEKEPYRCHPHKLVGKDGRCKKGVCCIEINTPDMTATFQVKKLMM